MRVFELHCYKIFELKPIFVKLKNFYTMIILFLNPELGEGNPNCYVSKRTGNDYFKNEGFGIMYH